MMRIPTCCCCSSSGRDSAAWFRLGRVRLRWLRIGVPDKRITAASISAETALLLSSALGTTPQFWMNGQALYELALANKTCRLPEIKKIAAVR